VEHTVILESLSMRYPRSRKPALDSIDLELNKGMFGILGPNGAGKTTLLRILATLLRPTGGRAVIFGHDVAQQPDLVRPLLGYLPQDFNTYRQLTIEQTLDYIALLKDINDAQARRQELERVLSLVHLTKERRLQVRHLSGGMKQRLGIAQALLGSPRILIVDEPTAGLDPEERIRFRNLLADLANERTVILSTHIVGDVEKSCGHLAVISQGKLLFTGEPTALAKAAYGMVWETHVNDGAPESLPAYACVVATRPTRTGRIGRVICPHPPTPDSTPAEPSLEDGYLVIMGACRGDSK